MTTATKLANFTVELGDDKASNFSVPVLNGVYRGTFDKGAIMSRTEGNKDVGSRNAALPHIVPGIHFEVDWRKRCVHITDPLTQEVLKQIRKAQNQPGMSTYGLGEYAKCDDVTIQMDEHQLKTFARYLVQQVDNGKGKCVDGRLPTLEQVDATDGRYLYNPNNPQSRPKFEDDAAEYFDRQASYR
jgi:hypothetical protein